jgi:cell division protein FtsL
MTQLVITQKLREKDASAGVLGRRYPSPKEERYEDPFEFDAPKEKEKKKTQGETFEKVVKRIPTFYVIIFFAVFTSCAVLIIWNTLQVNRLTYEKARLESKIEQTEQRIVKLKAQEMQLSAPERVREIATRKLGMTEARAEDEVIVKQH